MPALNEAVHLFFSPHILPTLHTLVAHGRVELDAISSRDAQALIEIGLACRRGSHLIAVGDFTERQDIIHAVLDAWLPGVIDRASISSGRH